MRGLRRKRSNRESCRVWSLSNKSISKVTKRNCKTKLSENDMRMVEEWTAARTIKDYATADRIRGELLDKGVEPYEHVPRSSLRRATSKLTTAKPRTQMSKFDLAEHLQDWVTAKQNGDARTADCIYTDLQACGIDPQMVWPDMEMLSDSEEESSSDEMPLLANRDINPNDWHVWGIAENPATTLEEKKEVKVDDIEIAIAAVAAHDYFHPSPFVSAIPFSLTRSTNVRLSPDLLQSVPCRVQTCDSLLTFLDKRLAGCKAVAPSVQAPQELLQRLEEFAGLSGRVASISSPNHWDARARRILDIPAYAIRSPGCDILREAKECLEDEARTLEHLLSGECSKKLQDLICDRREWAWNHTRREWMACCRVVLASRRSMLSTEQTLAETKKAFSSADDALVASQLVNGRETVELDMLSIFKMLLAGIASC